MLWSTATIALLLVLSCRNSTAFSPSPRFTSKYALVDAVNNSYNLRRPRSLRSIIFNTPDNEELEEDDDSDDDEDDYDPYTQIAQSEFLKNDESNRLGSPVTSLDWGGALGKLRERIGDQESGESQKPSNALYRLMTSQTPNEAISTFVTTANPEVVSAMSAAVSSLLGGLASPAMGVEIIVKASGEKIGNLCFQLQMTGYMFRNAEYVLALKDLMNLQGSASLQDYKDAFYRMDADGSGFIESSEIETLLKDVYEDGSPPALEVDTFMNFFDSDNDGRICWNEFERGLGSMTQEQAARGLSNSLHFPPIDDDNDEDELYSKTIPIVSGKIQIELKNGKSIEVEAKDYIQDLKKEAEALKEALRRESSRTAELMPGSSMMADENDNVGGITAYIASLGGDIDTLTEGISPDVVAAMRLLVDFVIDGKHKNKETAKSEVEMEIPGSALQQLALWQLVVGYRLREAEATGEYLRLLE